MIIIKAELLKVIYFVCDDRQLCNNLRLRHERYP